jgi:hypothetical protein
MVATRAGTTVGVAVEVGCGGTDVAVGGGVLVAVAVGLGVLVVVGVWLGVLVIVGVRLGVLVIVAVGTGVSAVVAVGSGVSVNGVTPSAPAAPSGDRQTVVSNAATAIGRVRTPFNFLRLFCSGLATC